MLLNILISNRLCVSKISCMSLRGVLRNWIYLKTRDSYHMTSELRRDNLTASPSSSLIIVPCFCLPPHLSSYKIIPRTTQSNPPSHFLLINCNRSSNGDTLTNAFNRRKKIIESISCYSATRPIRLWDYHKADNGNDAWLSQQLEHIFHCYMQVIRYPFEHLHTV